MELERLFYPVQTLGYGKRVGIWLVGCPHRCFNCCNPEIQQADKTKQVHIHQVFQMISSIDKQIDGVTISGGDPFFQAEELAKLVEWLRKSGIDDILIYSGYTLKQLQKMKNAHVDFVLQNIAVLVDGLYIENLNDNIPLRGSSNQTVYVLNEKYQFRYETYFKGERTMQTIVVDNNLISFGIPPKHYKQRLEEKSFEKGLLLKNNTTSNPKL